MRLFKWKLFGIISAPLLGLVVIFSLLLPVLISSQSASAASGNVTKETEGVEIFRAIKYYHGIEFCASKDGFKKEIGGDDVTGGPQKWVHYDSNKNMTIGTAIDKWGDKNGKTNCTGDGDGQNWMNDALQLFGIDPNGGESSLKKLGYSCSIVDGSKKCTNDGINGTIMDIVRGSTYAKGTPLGDTTSDLYKVAAYAGAFKAFQVSCAGKKGGNTGLVSISIVDAGKISKQDWSQNGETPYAGVDSITDMSSSNNDSCQSTIVNVINSNADAYQLWSNEATCKASFPDLASDANKVTWCARGRANATNSLYCVTATTTYRNACFIGAGHPKDGTGKTSGELCIAMAYANPELEACIKGALNKSNANFCNSTYPAPDNLSANGGIPNDTNKAKREACTEGAKLAVSGGGVVPSVDTPITPADGDPETTTCVIDSVGWIVCPIVGFASTMSDVLYGWISSYLKVQPLNVDISSDNNTMYVAWNIMRNIANVAFVIVFIIIIYSQLTGMGVSNYGVKKALPRLIVAAILVNLSYWVAAAAVDISNIVGNNLYNVLKNLPLGNVAGESIGWEALSGWLLAGGVATGVVVAGASLVAGAGWAGVGLVALYVLIPIIIAVVLALVLAFVVLALRQALIIVMIVIAPLAFVAMLLPNTEKYFKMWQKSLMTLLIFYPLFSLLFGGAYVAGMIIIGSAGSTTSASPAMTVIIGMAITTLPLFLTPMLIKFSSGIMGQVASGLNGKFKNNPLSKAMKNLRNRKAGLAMGEAFGRNSRNPFNRGYRAIQNNRQSDEKRKENISKSNKAAYLETDRAANLEHIGEATTERIKTAEAEHKAAFEGHVATTPNLMQQRQRQDAAARATARHSSVQKEQIEGNLSMASRVMDQQKANSDLRTQGITDQQKLDIERNQEANSDLRNTRLQNAGITKELGALEKDRQRVVTQAGTIGGGMELEAQGYDPSSIQRIQTAQASTADSELRIAHATGETELETTLRQNTNQELSNVKLTTEAARRDKGAADKEFEQVVTEATSTTGGDLLVQRGYDTDAIARIQDSQIDTAVATAATTAAQRVQQDEFTTTVKNDEVLPSGQTITQAMAGIDTQHGETLARAQAIETQRQAREKNVSAYSVQLRDAGTNSGQLSGIALGAQVDATGTPVLDPLGNMIPIEYAPEQREAAVKMMVDGGDIDKIKPYINYLTTAAANPANTPEQTQTISDLQKAFAERITSSPGKPVGLGPVEIDALRAGTLGTAAAPVVMSPRAIVSAGAPTLTPVETQTLNTVLEKGVSADSWASMDKSDIATISMLISAGFVPQERLDSMTESLDTSLTDPRIKPRIKEREDDLLRKLYSGAGGTKPNLQPK